MALLVTFIFIIIYFKNISNPLLAYAAIGVIGIPAVIYGLLHHYEILLIIAAIYIPHNAILPADFGGIQKALNGTNIVLAALLLGYLINKVKGQALPYQRGGVENKLIAIFAILASLSFARGAIYFGSTYASAMIFELKRFLTPLLIYMIFIKSIKDKESIKIIFSICLIVIIMAIFLGLLEWVNLGFGTYSTFTRRLGGLNKQPNSFGAFISFYICLFLAQLLVNFRKLDAKLLIFPFILGLRVLLPTNSRGAWIAFPPAFVTVSFFRSKFLFIGVILLIILPFMFISELIPETIRYRFDEALQREKAEIYYHPSRAIGVLEESKSISMKSRAILLQGGLKMWRTNMFFGYGYGTFTGLVGNYTENGMRGGAHNFILQILCEMGIFAFLSLFAILGIFFKSAVYIFRREKDLFLKGLALGYTGIIPAILVANLTGNRFTHVDLLTIFWILSACIGSLKRQIRIEATQQLF